MTIENPTEKKDEIVFALVLAVAAVEVFVNSFFRVLVSEAGFQHHQQRILDDLDISRGPRGLDYKLCHWPQDILGHSLAWQKGGAKAFDEIRGLRNALMHFTSSNQSQAFEAFTVHGLANTTVYDELSYPTRQRRWRLLRGSWRSCLGAGVFRKKIFRTLYICGLGKYLISN